MELRLRSEVQEQPDLEARRAQIVLKLSRRGAMELVCRLGFDDEPVLDEHVETLRRYALTLVPNRDALLALDMMAARPSVL